MKRQRLNWVIKILVFTFLILVGLFLLFRGTKVLLSSDYFKIKYIRSNQNDILDLSYLKGKNIFSLDLKKEADNILNLYPNYREVKILKILPNYLNIILIPRRPQAIVRLYRDFYVDEDLVFFNNGALVNTEELPVIIGLETKIFGITFKKKYYIKELRLALEIIKKMKESPFLKDYSVKIVDVDNPSYSKAFLLISSITKIKDNKEALLEVRFGEENIDNKVNILSDLLNRIKKDDLYNIKYIDLRFKDPVVKIKDVK
ncbi:MAG: hypothetical protein NC912_04290 [Candidatus Omnitrophica bacterium]|nr:hypothetical protein [Candidatus Omnitrophota bacterium]